MKKLFLMTLMAVGLLAQTVVSAPVPLANKTKGPPPSIRQTKNWEGKVTAIETGVLKYRHKNGQEVDFHNAIHIAEKSFFQKKNIVFTAYEAVLYEGVKPGKRNEKIAPPGLPQGIDLAKIQRFMGNALKLSFQKDIMRPAKNWVWADLTIDEINGTDKKKPEGQYSQMAQQLRSMADMLEKMEKMGKGRPGAGGFQLRLDPEFLIGIATPNGRKRLLSSQIINGISQLEAQKELFEKIVVKRNKAVMKVLDTQITAGKKKIAVWYGAGHMGDFHKRMLEKGYEYVGTTDWTVAWDCRFTKQEIQLIMMYRMMRDLEKMNFGDE